jgi:hypothetical protein
VTASTGQIKQWTLAGARAALLAGPTVLAFFTGGYFASTRDWAGAVVWLLVAIAALLGQRLVPRHPAGRLALAGLALFAGWTLLSALWAPLAGSAWGYGETAALYAGVMLAATALLRGRMALRVLTPALAGGALIVIGYGISERLLPGLLSFSHSTSAEGRLEQPLTYWNAMGEVAALGFVLCTALAGDATRRRWLRSAAAAAAAPLGMGLYITFSRGALFACAAGLVALVVLVPRREQLRAIGVCLAAGVLSSLAAAPFHGVTSIAGQLGRRESQGAIVFVLLAVFAAGAAAAQWRLHAAQDGEVRLPRRSPAWALALICAGLALAIVVGAHEGAGTKLSGGASRLQTFQSNRYAYWDVALRAFAEDPIQGVGAGGWAVWWLEHRKIDEFAQDTHSLPLQTLAELGLVGFALLLTFIGGVGWAARDARRVSPVLAGAPIAGFIVYVAHSPLDWDWEMPAVTIAVLVLAGGLLAMADLARR